jgi:excisionase family DNA binding protein
MAEETLTAAEVADRLRVTPWTVREWLRSRRLHGYQLGGRAGWRVRESDLAQFIAAREGHTQQRVTQATATSATS